MTACATAAYSAYLGRMDSPPGPMLTDYACEILNHDSFVLEVDGAFVGLLVLHIDDTGVLLDNVAILPGHQSLGYGRLLLEFAEEVTLSRGFSAITLYTNEVMTENIALYTRLGYMEYERALDNGYHRVYMRKTLAAEASPT